MERETKKRQPKEKIKGDTEKLRSNKKTKSKPPKTRQQQKIRRVWGQVRWPNKKKTKDYQPNMPPTKKTHFRANSGPQPENGCRCKFCHFRAWENIVVFCTYTKQIFEKLFLFFTIYQSKIAQISVSPFLARQPNTHECPPPEQKNGFPRLF